MKQTMLATMCVVLMLEISKHSMRRGGPPRPSASPSAARSASGIDGARGAEAMALVAGVARHRLGGLAQVVEHVAQLGGALEIELRGRRRASRSSSSASSSFELALEELAGRVRRARGIAPTVMSASFIGTW